MKELQNSSKIRLPIELIDQIISYTDNIELIYEFGSKYIHSKLWDLAAKDGNIDIIKYLHKNDIKGCTSYTFDYAVENNNLKIIKYLHKNINDVECTIRSMLYAQEITYKENGSDSNIMDYSEMEEWVHKNYFCTDEINRQYYLEKIEEGITKGLISRDDDIMSNICFGYDCGNDCG